MAHNRKDGSTYGNLWMYHALISLLKIIDVRVFYCFMSVCVIPFTLIFSPGARLTYRYYHHRRNYGFWKSWWSTYKNHCIFGETVIDKFAMYAGHKFKMNYNNYDIYEGMSLKPESFIQLSAHIGCSEVLGYSVHLSKPCNVLVYGGEKQSLMNYRESSFGDANIRMIPVGISSSHSEEIIEALDKGEIVNAFADRFMNKNKIVVSKIHGHEVMLAKGPFSLATTRGIDVIMVSAMKEKDGSYTAFFTPLPYDKTQPKAQQRQQIADAYTAEIERLLDIYPYQWFNYSDLWVEGVRSEE